MIDQDPSTRPWRPEPEPRSLWQRLSDAIDLRWLAFLVGLWVTAPVLVPIAFGIDAYYDWRWRRDDERRRRARERYRFPKLRLVKGRC